MISNWNEGIKLIKVLKNLSKFNISNFINQYRDRKPLLPKINCLSVPEGTKSKSSFNMNYSKRDISTEPNEQSTDSEGNYRCVI